jgi:hypothetical protein
MTMAWHDIGMDLARPDTARHTLEGKRLEEQSVHAGRIELGQRLPLPLGDEEAQLQWAHLRHDEVERRLERGAVETHHIRVV